MKAHPLRLETMEPLSPTPDATIQVDKFVLGGFHESPSIFEICRGIFTFSRRAMGSRRLRRDWEDAISHAWSYWRKGLDCRRGWFSYRSFERFRGRKSAHHPHRDRCWNQLHGQLLELQRWTK